MSRRDGLLAALLYVALTIAFTWPLARGLARDIPGDFGDPLLNSWIVSWGATHLGRGWWNANIFFPHPLALAYSEHLLPQALQILPIYAATKNPILCYNLVVLSTFVLSGVGMFLLARELTGSRDAAFVAGVAYAFAPYRVTSIPHLQVLSSAWMPFALFGVRRFFATRRFRPLAGGVLAWVAQNLSCGYYLLFFSPVVLIYLAWEITTRRLWRDARIMATVLVAVAVVFGLALPFVLPYLELRGLGFGARSLEETTRFSADVYAYLTADPNLRLWGSLVQAWPKAEGALFPGFTIIVLAGIAGVTAARTARVGEDATALRVLAAALAICGLVLVAMLLGWTMRSPVKITSIGRVAWLSLALAISVVVFSRNARIATRRWLASPAGIFTLIALFAMVMSWGPSIQSRGRTIAGANLYSAFYDFVPGFDGIRVPARFAMIVAFALAILASFGVQAVARIVSTRAVAIAASVAILLESLAVPIPINQNSTEYRQPGLAPLPGTISTSTAGAVYGFVSSLPPSAAVIELPIGEPAFDVRYMFYSTTHWRPLVNGYSGGAPADYGFLEQTLQDALIRPERAWRALGASNATHAIVHEAMYAGDRGPRMSAWLRSRGARELAAFGPDRIFQIP